MVADPVEKFIRDMARKHGIPRMVVREIFWTAFSSYLWREGCRHGKDIRQIARDLRGLNKKGYYPVRIPLDYWIEIPQ